MKWFTLSTLCCVAQVLAKPANDWSKPCFNGECAYDMPDSTGHTGVLMMSGPAITDITPAAGWVILDCDPHAMEQDIRLVCSSDDHEAAGCNHVFDNGGPVHKAVRLPENCSVAPFLRIASTRVAEDQSIPRHASGQVSKRDGAYPTVHIIRVDSNWAAADVSQTGPVNFYFTGANSPPSESEQSTPSQVIHARNVDWDPFGWLRNAWEAVKKFVVNAGKAAIQKLKELTGFKINPELTKSAHFKSAHDVTVFELEGSRKPKCDSSNGITANLKITASGEVTATVRIGIVANGSVIPPSIGSFAVYAITDANVDAHIVAKASVVGHIETPRKKLGHVDISPLQIPGVISLGPFVELEVQADFELGLEVNVDTHLKYKAQDLEFWYPRKLTQDIKQLKDGARSISAAPSKFDLAASANVAATANVTAHLIPSVHLGLSVAAGAATLSAFIEADIWTRVHLKGEVSVKTEVHHSGSQPHHKAPAHHAPAKNAHQHHRAVDGYVPPYLNARAIQAEDSNTNVGFKGCVNFLAGLTLKAGAKGEVGKYKAEVEPWVIFDAPEFSIYDHCWGTTAHRRSISTLTSPTLEKRLKVPHLKCGTITPHVIGGVNIPSRLIHKGPDHNLKAEDLGYPEGTRIVTVDD
ncbi:hypothetical protein ONZ45_g2437 [Pleurotus djamor]|nr:hypothetical protein ONZ45_g2437 [Pleurotus djamor]